MKPTYNGLTRCFAKKWEDQKVCEIKGAEKSRFRNSCIFKSINGNRTCSNPEAAKDKK